MSESISQAVEFIYSENKDKQRIVIIGEQAPTLFEMVKHVLKQYNRKVDYITEDQLASYQSLKFTEAPVLLMRYAQPPEALAHFQAHILIITNSLAKSELAIFNTIADRLPKSGILFADDREPVAAISKKERADVLTINFKAYAHSADGEGINLITSTNEKFRIKVEGEENLRCISAAKETLKRIGVSSGQFYQAITTFTV